MQSAFGLVQTIDGSSLIPWPGMCYAPEVAGAALATVTAQQQQQLQGLSSTAGANPVTPQAADNKSFNQYWQGAILNVAPPGMVELQAPEEASPEQKQRKSPKPKKPAGRRDIDKLAKQEQRMIKNRESAARSRLRRQQHTAELEAENEALKAEVASLKEQVDLLQGQLGEAEWQLQLQRVPGNMPRASITVSHNQQATGISHLPPAPSLSLSLPAASSLMVPALAPIGPEEAGVVPHDSLQLEAFDFAYLSRRGSSYA